MFNQVTDLYIFTIAKINVLTNKNLFSLVLNVNKKALN